MERDQEQVSVQRGVAKIRKTVEHAIEAGAGIGVILQGAVKEGLLAYARGVQRGYVADEEKGSIRAVKLVQEIAGDQVRTAEVGWELREVDQALVGTGISGTEAKVALLTMTESELLAPNHIGKIRAVGNPFRTASERAEVTVAKLDPNESYAVGMLDQMALHALELERERHEQTMSHLQAVYPRVKELLHERGVTQVSGKALLEDIRARLPGGALNPPLRTVERAADLTATQMELTRGEKLQRPQTVGVEI
jgi:hypothetical protein